MVVGEGFEPPCLASGNAFTVRLLLQFGYPTESGTEIRCFPELLGFGDPAALLALSVSMKHEHSRHRNGSHRHRAWQETNQHRPGYRRDPHLRAHAGP